jgi:hypothetical protein
MAIPVSDLDALEFVPIKTRLALAFLDQKADLGVHSDQAIVDHVDDIMAIMLALTRRAVREDDQKARLHLVRRHLHERPTTSRASRSTARMTGQTH